MKNTIIPIIALLALLVVALYSYELVFNKPLITEQQPDAQDQLDMPMLDIKEQYSDGTLTFVGTVDLPDPCHSIESSVKQTGENIYEINLTTIRPSGSGGCISVIAPVDFKVSFTASPDAIVTAVFDGVKYKLNRFEVPPGENIDTYELFIKG